MALQNILQNMGQPQVAQCGWNDLVWLD